MLQERKLCDHDRALEDNCTKVIQFVQVIQIVQFGPQVMKGYYKNVKATEETVDSTGWLHTGDIAFYNDQNQFFIVDRLKELIKVKGIQVWFSPSVTVFVEFQHFIFFCLPRYLRPNWKMFCVATLRFWM